MIVDKAPRNIAVLTIWCRFCSQWPIFARTVIYCCGLLNVQAVCKQNCYVSLTHTILWHAGSAFAIDFQQPLALPPLVVEWARVAEDEKATPDEIIGDLTASTLPGPADIADAINPANPDSPASGIANKVIESVQSSGPSAAQKALSDALGNPATDVAPKLQDAIENPAEILKPGREVSLVHTWLVCLL